MELKWKHLCFIWKYKKIRTAIKILNGKETVGWITVSELKVNYRATVIKTVCYTNRHADQCNSIEEPQISLHIYALLSCFKKEARKTYWKMAASSTTSAGQVRQFPEAECH